LSFRPPNWPDYAALKTAGRKFPGRISLVISGSGGLFCTQTWPDFPIAATSVLDYAILKTLYGGIKL
jgi:hypothetical protein